MKASVKMKWFYQERKKYKIVARIWSTDNIDASDDNEGVENKAGAVYANNNVF